MWDLLPQESCAKYSMVMFNFPAVSMQDCKDDKAATLQRPTGNAGGYDFSILFMYCDLVLQYVQFVLMYILDHCMIQRFKTLNTHRHIYIYIPGHAFKTPCLFGPLMSHDTIPNFMDVTRGVTPTPYLATGFQAREGRTDQRRVDP